MNTINHRLLKKFIDLAASKLEGDWILIGGSLLPLLGIEARTTTDIDFVNLNPRKSSNQDTLELMEIAESLKLPVEAINQAGAFFLSQQKITPTDLVLLQSSKKCKVYRPSATLYLLLKIERLSESDLLDCKEWLKFIRKNKESLDLTRLKTKIASLEKKSTNEEHQKRLGEFKSLIGFA